MIGRHAAIAGASGLAIYLSMYLAYGVVSGWSVPPWLAAGLGVFVAVGAALGTEVLIAALAVEPDEEG